MKRFKTKQELLNDKNNDGFGMGCDYFGEPLLKTHPSHHSNMFTTAPHPYEGVNIKMKVNPTQSKKVQEKAFKLGYGWGGGATKVKYVGRWNPDYYFFPKSKNMNRSEMLLHFEVNDSIELTPEQFLEGYLPEKTSSQFDAAINSLADERKAMYQKQVEDISKYYNGKLLEEMKNYNPEPKKLDAYVSSVNGAIAWLGTKEEKIKVSMYDLHQYNLMSEEAFKAKHAPVLKFMDWKVTVEDKHIRMRCDGTSYGGEKLERKTLRLFCLVMKIANKYAVNPTVLYNWLDHNKQELGI